MPEETPQNRAIRLAEAKAQKIAETETDAVIIGSDQVAVLNGKMLGKPGNHEAAIRQLQSMSGECVRFITALCVLNTSKGTKHQDYVICDVFFRQLTDSLIDRYLKAEKPYQCAGSFKSESLGISLVTGMDCPDPTALIGLPLIKLTEILNNQSYKIP